MAAYRPAKRNRLDVAILVYTKMISNPQFFDWLFIDARSALLAAQVCIALTGDKAMRKAQYEMKSTFEHGS